MPYGLIPWGTGFYGISGQPPTPIPPPQSNIHIINVNPAPGSFNISRSQTFTFTIKTSKYALDPNSIHIFLDEKVAVQGTSISTDFTVIATANIDGISIDYSVAPNYLFKDRDVFTLQIYATDIYGNPSYPFWAGYVVVDTRPPLLTPIYPLDKHVDVPIDLTVHFLVNQLAAPDAGLDRATLNVYVNDLHAVIDSVIQPAFSGIYSALNFPATTNITDPFEIILDYAHRYVPNDIVTIDVSVNSIIVPVIDVAALFSNQYGLPALDAYGISLPSFSINTITKLDNFRSQLTLDFGIGQSLILDGYIADGYQVKNSNTNVFRILDILDGYNVVVETLPKTLRGNYSFITTQFVSDPPTPVFAGYFQGVYLVDNLGDGYHINVTWHSARTTRPDDDLAYLVYYSTTRLDVFFEAPKLITQGRKLTLPELVKGADAQLFGYFAQVPLPVGVTYYFGVRATEYPHSTLPFVPADGYGTNASGRTAVDGYSFKIPDPQLLMANTAGIGAIVVTVTTTTGYATTGGYITVGAEIMKYTSLTNTTFVVAAPGRGLFGSTNQSAHIAGEFVKLYYGNYDDNTVIAKNLVSWEPPNDPKRTRPDLVTTDFTLEDGYHAGFEFFDYCGYHRARPDELLNDQQCGTYVGGEYNGHRGLSIYDRMLANEEQLLETTGEPVILLRRIWNGATCICRTTRKDSARVRSCSVCFGTGFKGGFVQYFNPRRIDHRVMVHFAASDEELGFAPQAGIEQKFKPGTWTIAVPSIKDRDLLIRFDEYGQREWIYVVNSVSRAKTLLGRNGRQRLNLSRMDKTDVAYQYKIVL